ncbi:phospholipase D-like domain-containing protein [Alicyclobacillus sendaiensis]|uniref:phospholipase D-like domain-containing protein n=1 Tax=Alicyclobacillus sendaiensis TaxID=192387 RepID=UPI000781C205|nr:phospholipase D-like domain-containing protein [Alicyclobacillus sendaiensis]
MFEMGFKMATYFSPDDDTQSVFLNFIRGTNKHLRIAVYSLHLPSLIDELIELHKRGVDVALVIDHTQAHGKAEHPDVLQLISAGIPLVEGTSQKHRIMHHKFAVRDKTTVLSGSWNFSESASLENNYFDIVESSERAALFLSKWKEMWDWIRTNEPEYQEMAVARAPVNLRTTSS